MSDEFIITCWLSYIFEEKKPFVYIAATWSRVNTRGLCFSRLINGRSHAAKNDSNGRLRRGEGSAFCIFTTLIKVNFSFLFFFVVGLNEGLFFKFWCSVFNGLSQKKKSGCFSFSRRDVRARWWLFLTLFLAPFFFYVLKYDWEWYDSSHIFLWL